MPIANNFVLMFWRGPFPGETTPSHLGFLAILHKLVLIEKYFSLVGINFAFGSGVE